MGTTASQPLTPDELVECLLDRIQQLEHGDSRGWERVDAAAQLSLHNAIELARGMISGLWDEVGVGAEERAAALDMMCPETQFSLGLLRRLRDPAQTGSDDGIRLLYVTPERLSSVFACSRRRTLVRAEEAVRRSGVT